MGQIQPLGDQTLSPSMSRRKTDHTASDAPRAGPPSCGPSAVQVTEEHPSLPPWAQEEDQLRAHYRRRHLLKQIELLAEDALIEGYEKSATVLREATEALRLALEVDAASMPALRSTSALRGGL